ncbi:MAG: sigma-70 family RNA polymerase sigma factor [Anaerolineae bacterium]|nr:sigma-70 family RNA polymerase sigma factor [Anaerolineae bacterium]
MTALTSRRGGRSGAHLMTADKWCCGCAPTCIRASIRRRGEKLPNPCKCPAAYTKVTPTATRYQHRPLPDQRSAGYDALYDQFAAAVYRLCYAAAEPRRCRRRDGNVRHAFRNLHRFNPQRLFKTWLFTIAICRCRNLYRRSRAPLIDFSQLLHLIGSKADAPEAMFAHQTAQDAVEQALRRLSPRLRE